MLAQKMPSEIYLYSDLPAAGKRPVAVERRN